MNQVRVDLPMCGIATFAKSELCTDLTKLTPDIDVEYLAFPLTWGRSIAPAPVWPPGPYGRPRCCQPGPTVHTAPNGIPNT